MIVHGGPGSTTRSARGRHVVQPTIEKQSPDAERHWRSLGLEATHEGRKLELTAPGKNGRAAVGIGA